MNVAHESDSIERTVEIGRAIGASLTTGDCVALVGPLGAGKTALVRGLAMGFGAEVELVSSPTYVLAHEYPAGDRSLFHLDVYRLAEPEAEFADLGVEDMLAAGAVVVEWADRVADALPTPRMEIEIEPTGAESRRLTVRRIE